MSIKTAVVTEFCVVCRLAFRKSATDGTKVCANHTQVLGNKPDHVCDVAVMDCVGFCPICGPDIDPHEFAPYCEHDAFPTNAKAPLASCVECDAPAVCDYERKTVCDSVSDGGFCYCL